MQTVPTPITVNLDPNPRAGLALAVILAGTFFAAATNPGAAQTPPDDRGSAATSVARSAPALDPALLSGALQRAAALPSLRTVLVAQHGRQLAEMTFRGPGPDTPVNVKSVSKTVIAALVGVAIGRDILEGVEQRMAPLLGDRVPGETDPRVRDITVEHLLAMRAGLERTSGANYGLWVQSSDWVRFALSRPFVDEPGGEMLYSTGNSHLLSAILTRASGRSTLQLAREWLGEPLAITIPAWQRDPQGVYLGGNEMALSPRAMLRLGELYRNGGVVEGRRVFPESWVEASWTPQGRSRHSGHEYGYGWFITQMRGYPVYYAWGYGGQMIYVVPDLGLTAVMTSDPTAPSGRSGYVSELHALVSDGIIAAGTPASY